MKRIFLGGTCNDSKWREQLIPLLRKSKLDYFDPVIKDDEWDEEAQQRELNERVGCDFCCYTVTPKMTGSFSIAEAVDDSNKRPEKVIFCVLETDDEDSFDEDQLESLEAIGLMIERNGGYYCKSLEAVVLHVYQSCEITVESILEELPFSKFR